MADQGQKENFIAALTELGGSAGNGRLREALQWGDATYSDAKEELIAADWSRLAAGAADRFSSRPELTYPRLRGRNQQPVPQRKKP